MKIIKLSTLKATNQKYAKNLMLFMSYFSATRMQRFVIFRLYLEERQWLFKT
jgi:hypothetical protein